MRMKFQMQVAKKGPKDRPKEAPGGAQVAQTGPTDRKTTDPSGPDQPNSLKKTMVFARSSSRPPNQQVFTRKNKRGKRLSQESRKKAQGGPKGSPRAAQGSPIERIDAKRSRPNRAQLARSLRKTNVVQASSE